LVRWLCHFAHDRKINRLLEQLAPYTTHWL